MNIFKKIFGSSRSATPSLSNTAVAKRNQEIQAAADQLWQTIRQVLIQYDEWGCACQFPRFHQYVQIDCVDLGKSFYMSETEGFISQLTPYFDIINIPPQQESYSNVYTCKKCGSTYQYGWSDFSISVSRACLKVTDKKVEDIGADPVKPVPFYVGLFGHALPPTEDFEKVDLETLKVYLLEKRVMLQAAADL